MTLGLEWPKYFPQIEWTNFRNSDYAILLCDKRYIDIATGVEKNETIKSGKGGLILMTDIRL